MYVDLTHALNPACVCRMDCLMIVSVHLAFAALHCLAVWVTSALVSQPYLYLSV